MAVEILPTRCTIDSRLGALADALDLDLVERNTAAPASSTAEAWRSLDEGDLVRVRLGLEGLGYDDYGVFRVDACELARTEAEMTTRIRGRDKAALLVEERWREFYGFGAHEDNPTEETWASARWIARQIAARVGLGLVWDAPNYALKGFVVQPEDSASQALSRLLEPLRVSRRYPADAWVDGENLVVRRRGNGVNSGALDCSLGMVRSISRRRQPQVGQIDVYGATYTWLTEYEQQEKVHEAGEGEAGEATASVRIVEESPTHRTTETGQLIGGNWKVTDRTTEDHTYKDVRSDGIWIGRLLVKSVIEIETNLSAPYPTRRIKTISYGQDEKWRLVLKDEGEQQRDQETGAPSIFRSHTITLYEQITPTHLRVRVTKYDKEGKELSAEYQDAPGTLQSSILQAPAPDSRWQENEAPSTEAPAQVKVTEHTDQYHSWSHGGGTIPRVYRNENLRDICGLIAADLDAESGKWLYAVGLSWPRPFPYRKGQKITLTNLPGGCPDLEGVIIGLMTRFDSAEAIWTHEVDLECWRDA